MTGTTVPSTPPDLPANLVWIAHEGVRGEITRDKVIRVTRRLMMAAHHQGLTGWEIQPLLEDRLNYRLARQIAYGLTPKQVDILLGDLWPETRDVFHKGGYWTPNDHLELAQAYVDANGHLWSDRVRMVMEIAMDRGWLKEIPGKTALTVRLVEEESAKRGTKISRSDASRILGRLAKEGKLLRLVEAGRPGTVLGKANLYELVPIALRAKKVGTHR